MNFQRLFLMLFSCALLLGSCSGLSHLESAQSAFSQAAEIENTNRYSYEREVSASPAIYYQLAQTEIEQALKKERKLEGLRLLGHALALKAMTEWRLKEYGAARISSKEALRAFDRLEQRQSRDEAMMLALPDLIQLDSSRAEIFTFFATKRSLPEAEAFYAAEVHNLENPQQGGLYAAVEALEKLQLPPGAPPTLEAYFLQARLAGLQSWDRALDFMRQTILSGEAERDRLDERYSQEYEQYLQPRKAAALERLQEVLPGGTAHPVYQFWKLR